MYYIWYFNDAEDDFGTFQFLTKGSDISELWDAMLDFWNYPYWKTHTVAAQMLFERVKREKSLIYGFTAINPYSFLIEYIGD